MADVRGRSLRPDRGVARRRFSLPPSGYDLLEVAMPEGTAIEEAKAGAPRPSVSLALAAIAVVLLVCMGLALIFAPESDPTLILGQSTGDLWWLAYGGSLGFAVAATAVGAVEQAGPRRARSIGFWIGLALSVLLVAGLVCAGIAALLAE